MNPFPWKDAMRFGLGVLRLSPEAFWKMTPRELASAWGAVMGERSGPLDRRGLENLMEHFPDGQ
ncbi:rcc01693 family protein [Devosia faecipullorum]|uniref:rcc01693 family protein n=1 Tax=Devosia faecipullorum TaxID=2755039 RepID=UPI00187BB8EE|nr:rcc01693 family protein [Devosia faecipullorum]MBE7733656.1 phage tail assembly chaperone [Devosia faecipullorum]